MRVTILPTSGRKQAPVDLSRLGLSALFFLFFTLSATAVPLAVDVDASLSFQDQWVWRGRAMADRPAAGAGLSLTADNIGLEATGMTVADDDSDAVLVEDSVALSIVYKLPFHHGREMSLRCSQYWSHGRETDPLDGFEAGLQWAMPLVARPTLRPELSAVFNQESRGWIIQAALMDTFPAWAGKADLDAGIAVSWSDTRYAERLFHVVQDDDLELSDGVVVAEARLAMPWMLSSTWELVPAVVFSSVLQDSLRDVLDARGESPDILRAGLMLRAYF